jgi:hypothetical protein
MEESGIDMMQSADGIKQVMVRLVIRVLLHVDRPGAAFEVHPLMLKMKRNSAAILALASFLRVRDADTCDRTLLEHLYQCSLSLSDLLSRRSARSAEESRRWRWSGIQVGFGRDPPRVRTI